MSQAEREQDWAIGREIERKDAEIERLREIISQCAAALPNGAVVSPDCSVEFMANLPAEIRLCFARLNQQSANT